MPAWRRLCTNSASYEYKNKSASNGAQLVPIGMPIVLRRPATGFKHVRLLHDNAPPHTSAIVTAFLKKEKVTVLPQYSPDLAPCDFFLFPKLKAFLAGRKYQSRQALGSAIHQYLISVPKSAYRDAFKKWIHRLKLCISSHGEYFEGMK